MAIDLHVSRELSLKSKLSKGIILALKSTQFDLGDPQDGRIHATHLDLYNRSNDIVLRITIRRGQNKVFFNDRADKSLSDGWGQEQSLDLSLADVDRWKRSGVTISVQDRSTPSEMRFQIFFDLTTVYSFNRRFPGSATKLTYSSASYRDQLSSPLKVLFYELNDLPLVERQAVESGRVPSLGIPAPGRAAISIRPSHFIQNHTYASISWEYGREIRIYYLGPNNVLHEYAYSASKGKNSWYYGSLQDLNIILHPDSSIAAVQPVDGIICIYYQDPKTDLIRVLHQRGTSTSWEERPDITRAVKGSSFAVVRCPDLDPNKIVSRIYYQDPDLYLRERYYDHLSTPAQWVLGGFNPGVQLRGTPITAEVVHGSGVDINVMWRDPQGRAVTSSWSKSSGWDLPDSGMQCEDGRD